MSVTVDAYANGYDVFVSSIGRWDDDPTHSVDEKQKLRIADNIKRAFESQGD